MNRKLHFWRFVATLYLVMSILVAPFANGFISFTIGFVIISLLYCILVYSVDWAWFWEKYQ